jgi:hypothetical protein
MRHRFSEREITCPRYDQEITHIISIMIISWALRFRFVVYCTLAEKVVFRSHEKDYNHMTVPLYTDDEELSKTCDVQQKSQDGK